MNLILQISTGSFANCSIQDIGQMKARLEDFMKRLPVSRMIFGWGIKPGIPEALLEIAEKFGVEKILWLPVFADTEQADLGLPLEAICQAKAKQVNTCPGEEFRFMCPNSEKNVELALASYEKLTGSYSVDGVFLDRIRYPSAVFSPYDFFGCYCEHCRKEYFEKGIDTDRLRRRVQSDKSLRAFLPVALKQGCYHYEDPDLERLCEAKRKTILRVVTQMAEIFKRKKLTVGIDAFAPALADCVGQDLYNLSKTVDFIKPMMYYQTTAPAGIPYELKAYGEALTERICELWGMDIGQPSSLKGQILSLRGKAEIMPGIEVNRVPGICEPKAENYQNFFKAISEAKCNEAVLCWNVLNAPGENIRVVEKALSASC